MPLHSLPCLCTCLECSLGERASKQPCPSISLQTYALCQRSLAPAWPTFHAGGMIRKMRPAPNSSMAVAKGTITTSNLKLSAGLSAPKGVSPGGPDLHAHPGHSGRPGCWLVHSRNLAGLGLTEPVQSGGKNAAHRGVSRGCFGKERVARGVVVKGMWENTK